MSFFDYIPPSKEELRKSIFNNYEQLKKNPNAMSYWLPKIKDCGFKIPDTIIMPLDFGWYYWLISDSYSEFKIKEFTDYIIDYLKKSEFNTNRELFIKTGNFSNKFMFGTCKLSDLSRIGQQYLDIFYSGMCVGCPESPEVVVREYIKPKHIRSTIYEGMPLNTEFRLFYDFDAHALLECFNYWDTSTMLTNLRGEDLSSFKESMHEIEQDYNDDRKFVMDMTANFLETVQFTGKWSVDIMKCGDEYYLIDMGIAEQSYYFNKLSSTKD